MTLLSVDLLQDLKDLDEEVDDVQVELDGGQDVLLGTKSGHDHLGVHNDEHGEEECSSHSQSSVCHLIAHEHLEEAAEDEDKEAGGEGSVHVGEVMLGLEGEGGQPNNNSSGEEECLDDNALVKEGHQNSCKSNTAISNQISIFNYQLCKPQRQ